MAMGRIHSWESMGLVDGPGIRTVIFLQGCRLRCRYCHNPDTWELCGGGTLESPEETVNRLMRFKPYYGADGGVTFSGGEPLLQKEFLTEVLALCKSRGIHTCLDTTLLRGRRRRYVFRRGAAVTEGISDRGPCPV